MDYSGKSNRMNRLEKQKTKKQPYSSKHVRNKESLLTNKHTTTNTKSNRDNKNQK